MPATVLNCWLPHSRRWAARINLINAFFLTLASAALNELNLSDVLKIAAVLIMNSVCGAIAQYLFTFVRHQLRIKLCRRLSIEPSESNIAVMESIEYQTV